MTTGRSDAVEQPVARPIWIRASTANLWANPQGCQASCTFEPAAHGSEETAATLRGTRLHAAVASIISPGPACPRPPLEEGEWAEAQRAVSELEAHVEVDAYDWRVETSIAREMGDGPSPVLMSSTPDLVGLAKTGGWRGAGLPVGDPGMVIVDWKFGRQPVEAEDNYQLQAYAVLLLRGEDKWASSRKWVDTDLIRTLIVQPSGGERGDPVVKKATLSYRDVKNAENAFDYLVDRVRDAGVELEYNPSAANCRYCRGAVTGECPEVVGSLARAEDAVAGSGIADYGLLPPSGYGEFLAKADLVAEMARHVREDAHRRLERGEPVEGLKLVQGRAGNRKWRDERAAERALRSRGDHGGRVDPFTAPRLKSPSVLEREFRQSGCAESAAVIEEHWDRAPGATSVVYVSDPRPGLDSTAMGRALEHFSKKTGGQ